MFLNFIQMTGGVSASLKSDQKLFSSRYSRLGLDDIRRENIGRQTKRVLDLGRLKYLQMMTDMDVQLKHYVSSDVSLENALLICTERKKNS